MTLPWLIASVSGVIAAILLIKNLLLQKGMRDICSDLKEHLLQNTNTLISVSSNNKNSMLLASELNKLLRSLRKERQQYMSGNIELKNAVTNISHDLRTPLSAIFGYLDLIEKEEKSEVVQRYIEVIQDRAHIMKQLTEELFRYSVILSRQNNITREPVVVNTVLEESIAAFYTQLCERGIIPSIQIPEIEVIRHLNESALSRVFANLLNNAIKYSDGDLTISLSETGKIIFANTASGMNEVQVGKLFDRFYTVEAARKSTGLGLAIARSLTEQMDGTICAQYKNDKLTICIHFPDLYLQHGK